jgi:hypothetical protein
VPRHAARLVVDYFADAARPGDSAHHAARCRLLLPRRASGCLGTSRGSSLTTSPTSRVRVTRHIARLVVDYFSHAARPGASARRAVRRRLLHLRCAFGCLGLSRGSSCRLIVDYFTYVARPGASARRAARRVARRRLLRLRRASGCLGMLRGSSRCSSSTTSPPPLVRVPRHVARLVTWLVVDYSVRQDFILRPHWLYFSHAVRRDYLSRGHTSSTSSTPRAAMTSSSGRIASTIHLD